MKFLTDEKIEALSDEEKFNALEVLDFQSISQDVCDKCYRAEDCDGYFSGSCPCYGYWDDILTNLLKAEQDIKRAIKHNEDYEPEPEERLPDEFPLSTLGFFEGHLCSGLPYYG